MTKFQIICMGGHRSEGYDGWTGAFDSPGDAVRYVEHMRCEEECHQDDLPELEVVEVEDDGPSVRAWCVGLSLTLHEPEPIPDVEEECMDMVRGVDPDDTQDRSVGGRPAE